MLEPRALSAPQLVAGHPRRAPLPCAALLGLAGLALASPARAAELLIAAPSACVIGDELSFRAERALGQPLDTAADVRCTVHITRDGVGYAARLEVQSIASSEPSRLRSFSAPSCEMLTETLALAVSLAIASGAPESEPAASEPAASEPAASALDAATAATAAAHTRSEPAADARNEAFDASGSSLASRASADGWRIGAGAALVADAGTLPGLGMGATLGVSVGVDALDLRLSGTYLPPRDAQVESVPASGAASPGAEIELLAGGLAACAPRLVRVSNLALGACAGAELGWLSGKGTGVTVARSGSSRWTAARADAGARWTLAQGLSLELSLSALVPWARDEFSIDGVGRVFRTSPVVGRTTFGLSYELGTASR